MSLKPTTPEDIDALVALTEATAMFRPMEIEALREVLDDYFAANQAEGHVSLTYVEEGEILGFVYFAPAPMTDRSWHLWWIVVKATAQGQGVGGIMLNAAEAEIRNRLGRVLFIETGSMPHYEPTRRFYLKHAYERHAELRDFYAAGDSMVVFRKAL